MIARPETAVARDDLPFLRHRSRPASSGAPPTAVADFIHSRGPRRRPAGGAAATVPSAPDHAADTTPAPAVGNELDLSSPATGAAPTGAAPAAAPTDRPVPPAYRPRRTTRGTSTILSPTEPVVTLSRVQSGVGVLTIEAACSPAVGDLRLGCAYQLASDYSGVVQQSSAVLTAPPQTQRPIIVAGRAQFERLTIDLVQSRMVERLIVYAFSERGTTLNWGGVLVTTTLGGSRIELPLTRPPSARVSVLQSMYNIRGEFVVRAEMEQFDDSVQAAVTAYGFDRITWLDPRNPLIAAR